MINECTAKELNEKLKSNDNCQFIDCRESGEWQEAHIAGDLTNVEGGIMSWVEEGFPIISE